MKRTKENIACTPYRYFQTSFQLTGLIFFYFMCLHVYDLIYVHVSHSNVGLDAELLIRLFRVQAFGNPFQLTWNIFKFVLNNRFRIFINYHLYKSQTFFMHVFNKNVFEIFLLLPTIYPDHIEPFLFPNKSMRFCSNRRYLSLELKRL